MREREIKWRERDRQTEIERERDGDAAVILYASFLDDELLGYGIGAMAMYSILPCRILSTTLYATLLCAVNTILF